MDDYLRRVAIFLLLASAFVVATLPMPAVETLTDRYERGYVGEFFESGVTTEYDLRVDDVQRNHEERIFRLEGLACLAMQSLRWSLVFILVATATWMVKWLFFTIRLRGVLWFLTRWGSSGNGPPPDRE